MINLILCRTFILKNIYFWRIPSMAAFEKLCATVSHQKSVFQMHFCFSINTLKGCKIKYFFSSFIFITDLGLANHKKKKWQVQHLFVIFIINWVFKLLFVVITFINESGLLNGSFRRAAPFVEHIQN